MILTRVDHAVGNSPENILRRKELYTAEASNHFSGNVFVPDDLETIEL